MTLCLDDLERKARWFRDECTSPIVGPDPDEVLALIERVRTAETERDDWRKRWEQEDENSRRAREDAQELRARINAGLSTLSGAEHVVLDREAFDRLVEPK